MEALKVNLLKKNDMVIVSDGMYGDLIDKWLVVHHGKNQRLFVKHCRFYHPIKKRFLILQVVISDYKAGILFEGIFEGKANVSNWISMKYSDQAQMEIPQINLCDGNFPPTILTYQNETVTCNYLSIRKTQILYDVMIQNGLATLDEIQTLKSLSESEINSVMPLEIN